MLGHARIQSPMNVDFHEETADPLVADMRNFCKVEKWTRDGTKIDSLLHAGNSLGSSNSLGNIDVCCRLTYVPPVARQVAWRMARCCCKRLRRSLTR